MLRNATARVAAPSVCFAVACILLAAAPTAPPCFRRWRRSSPLLPKGEALASRATSYWTPEVQYGAKKRASLQRAAASGQRTLSSCRWPRQQGTTVHETNKLCASRGNLTGLPRGAPHPGCGSQRLLRYRLHPAGRCPNSSSLFPPLAAVVAVAPFGRAGAKRLRGQGCWRRSSPLLPKGEAFEQR